MRCTYRRATPTFWSSVDLQKPWPCQTMRNVEEYVEVIYLHKAVFHLRHVAATLACVYGSLY